MDNSSLKNLKRYNHLVGEIDAAYHDASLKLGMSDSVLRILYTICNVGDSCLLSEICKQTGLSKQTVNSAIRKMENEGIIYLEAVDRKIKNVCLSEKGKALAGQTAFRIIDIENGIFESWPLEEVQKYLELTERFLTDLRDKIELLEKI